MSGLVSSSDFRDLAMRAYDAIRDPWWKLQQRATRSAHECLKNRNVLLAAKEYTEALVTPLLMDAPFVWRSYNKPLGYPGDFQIMDWCYSNGFEGSNIFGQVFHKFYVDFYPLSVGVRTRKSFMVEMIAKEHQRVISCSNGNPVFNAVSLGCGPAKEVSDYVGRAESLPGKTHWTLIDQEEEALSVAYQASRREIGRRDLNAELNLLNLSFVQMLSEGLPLHEPGTQNLFFSVGIFDYLRESRAQAIIQTMYDLLAENGLIVIGNAVAPNEFYWAAEFVADWTLLYRTKEEMMGLAASLPESAETDVVAEPSGAYYFLLIRKH
jgi:SAM-dependent methyltransferase